MTLDDRRFDHHRMDRLMSPDRHVRWKPSEFINRFDIHPGASVLDLGSGPGFWTFPLADKVGATGMVWALDVSQEMLDELAKHNPPKQVHLVQSELPKINLPDASLDWLWAAFVYHEVTPPRKLADEMFRVTRGEGVVAILDWRPDAVGEGGPPRRHRLSVAQVSKFLHEAGFQSVKNTWQDDDAYLIEAKR